jgi:hypothetical protein
MQAVGLDEPLMSVVSPAAWPCRQQPLMLHRASEIRFHFSWTLSEVAAGPLAEEEAGTRAGRPGLWAAVQQAGPPEQTALAVPKPQATPVRKDRRRPAEPISSREACCQLSRVPSWAAAQPLSNRGP